MTGDIDPPWIIHKISRVPAQERCSRRRGINSSGRAYEMPIWHFGVLFEYARPPRDDWFEFSTPETLQRERAAEKKKNWSPPFHSSRFLLTSRWADGINQKRLIKCHIFISLGDDDQWVHFGSSRRPLICEILISERITNKTLSSTRYRTHH